jgi:peptidyl-prolyl cis-trans isomerase C
MAKLAREPFFHFVLLGAAMFAAFTWKNRNEPAGESGAEIAVGAAQIDSLVAGYQRTWQRLPSRGELDSLIEEHLTEEVLYREALALGLDRNDLIIRRRLRQKMEFLTSDVADLPQPDEAALQSYFSEHAARYAESPRLSFTQLCFKPDKRGAMLETDMKAALDALTANPQAAADQGDASLLPDRLEGATRQDIGGQFGEEFAAKLVDLPLLRWAGPVASGYGRHLVLVTAREEPQPTALAKVREAVMRDYQNEQRERLNRETVVAVKKRYRIHVDEAAVKRAALNPPTEKTE